MAATRDPEERLQLFVAKVDSALGRRAVREETLQAAFTITGGPEQSTFEFDTGDEEDVRSLLIDFRSFVASKEPEFANWVFNQLERHLVDEELRVAARNNRKYWDAAKAGPVRTLMNDRQFTAEQTFDLIVNGAIFHVDQDKAAVWSDLPEFVRQMMLTTLNRFVIDGLQVLVPTRNIVAEALEQGLFDFN